MRRSGYDSQLSSMLCDESCICIRRTCAKLIGVVGKSTTHPPCQKIGLELLEVGMHRSFVLPHMARPPAPPDEPPTGAMKKQGGYPGRVPCVPLLVFRVPEGERSVLSAAQIKFVTLVVRRVQRAPLEPNLPTGPLMSRYWLWGTEAPPVSTHDPLHPYAVRCTAPSREGMLQCHPAPKLSGFHPHSPSSPRTVPSSARSPPERSRSSSAPSLFSSVSHGVWPRVPTRCSELYTM